SLKLSNAINEFVKTNKSRAFLSELGTYANSKIIETPWHEPIPTNLYLLTALKDSPDAFLQAQNDKQIKEYVEKLNGTKQKLREWHNGGSSLIKQTQKYIDHVKKIESSFHFTDLGEECRKKIKEIETIRAKRWLPNFIIDLFTGE